MPSGRKLIGLIATFIVLTAALIYTGSPLITDAAPFGIVSFQFAYDAVQAHTILLSWDGAAHDAALYNLLLDFPYLVAYSWLLSLLCRAAADVSMPLMSRAGAVVARYVWLAGLFDAIENFALLHQLIEGTTDTAALLCGIAACAKFSVIAVALAYLLVAGVRLLHKH